MTEHGHVSIEDLAAYAAGDLDATASVAVEAHLLLCADCRADVEAVNAATGALAALPAVTMPDDVAARVDAALAAAAAAPAAAPHATILPMRRRRPTWAGIGAVAAGVALIGAVAVPLIRGGGTTAPTAAKSLEDSGTGARQAATRRLASNLNYSHDNLVATLNTALAGTTAPPAFDAAATPPAASPVPSGAPSRNTSEGSAAGVPLLPGTTSARTAKALVALQTDPGRFAACVTALVGDLPAEGRALLFVDFARFGGKSAVVLGFPNIYKGAVRENAIDVWVVGPGCGSTSGGDVLDFARIDRPSTL
jgi:hypothetical protein